MKNNEERETNESLKLAILILLSYIVPVVGMAFSIYVLIHSKTHPVEKWIRKLAVISLIIQLLIVALGVAGLATWYTN